MPSQSNAPYLFIANWKMYFSYQEACAWATENFGNIAQLLRNNNISFIACPSFEALASIAPKAQQHALYIGAQDCSAYTFGAYTGQIAAQSLAQLGCSFCIVGHSETRTYHHVSNQQIAQKVMRLLECNINPIVCVGETKKEYEQSQTLDVLRKQLEPIMSIFKHKNETLYIAYEPMWAIGTDIIPTNAYLNYIYENLTLFCADWGLENTHFMYGGSVNQTTIQQLNEITHIRGLLVGKASTDFQKIKTIVSLIKTG